MQARCKALSSTMLGAFGMAVIVAVSLSAPAQARTAHRHFTSVHHHRSRVAVARHRFSRMARVGASATVDRDRIWASYSGGSDLVSEARRWIGGGNPTHRRSLWCAAFMNFILERTGHRGTGSDMARSFASYGHRVSGPRVGAIAVMTRRGGGHVGVVSRIDASGNPIIISGNYGNRVREAAYHGGRIYAYVMP